MIKKITIKFGMELKPTQNSCKLQLYINQKNLPITRIQIINPKLSKVQPKAKLMLRWL